MENQYDVVIVGGGIVGVSLALILAKTSLKIALVESSFSILHKNKSETQRTIVLAYSSRKIFESMGFWPDLTTHACPIQEIHVSDQGHFGSARILAEEEKLPALGYVLQAEIIENTLYNALYEYKNISLIRPAKFISYSYQSNQVGVELEKADERILLTAKLLVAADGHRSSIRKFANIQTSNKNYHQTALVCNVDLKRPHGEIAYERFTEQGPLAMLPLCNQQSAVVWTVKKENATKLINLSKSEFISKLQNNFGYRLGKIINSSQPIGIDLALTTSSQQIAPGLVLLGNAVNTLHPVAGQGLNLALRDLAILAEVIYDAYKHNKILGSLEVLQHYLSRRTHDQKQIIAITHSLVGIFSNSLLPIVVARDAGIILLDRVKELKKILTKRTLGFSGKVPRLACGLSLE